MHCNLHDRMGAMRADRLGSPLSLALARRVIAAIGASGYPKIFIIMKWVNPASTEGADAQNGIVYRKSLVNGETQLLIHKGDSNVLVKGWADGELGITLGAGITSIVTSPVATLTGDFKKAIDTHGTPDTGDDTYVMTAGNYTADGDEA